MRPVALPFVVAIGLHVAGAAYAQVTAWVDSVLVLGPAYVRTPIDLFNETPPPGSDVPFLILGSVLAAASPLDSISSPDPAREYTFVIRDLQYTNSVLWDSQDGDYGGIAHEFGNGAFQLLADETPDLDLSAPASFEDGELLLSGLAEELYIGGMSCYCCRVEAWGRIVLTGGSLFPRVSRNGVGYDARLGLWAFQDAPFDSLRALGYQFPSDGRLDLRIPVAVEPTTWGRLKRLYSRDR